MLPLLNLKKTNGSILGKSHPFFKVILCLSCLTYSLAFPLRLEPAILLFPLLLILTLFVFSRAWCNIKIYIYMLLPFSCFFLIFSFTLMVIYLFKYGFAGSFVFYMDKLNRVSLMFIKGLLVISLSFILVITTNRREILYLLKKIRIPEGIISQLMLVIRSLHLLIDEFRLLPLALRSRGWTKKPGKRRVNNLIHSVFYRAIRKNLTFEYALHSRNFNGEFFTLYSPPQKDRERNKK